VRPLALAGIPCVAMERPGHEVEFSRMIARFVAVPDVELRSEAFADRLAAVAAAQADSPVLYYGDDATLLLVSRHRERLAEAARFVIASETLIEGLTDKLSFGALAARLGLPVPPAQAVSPARQEPQDIDLPFPVVVKPRLHANAWDTLVGGAKALVADSPGDLLGIWPALAATGIELLAQEYVPGPETAIESYHAYVAGGSIVADFTGRKIRTLPRVGGESTAVEITDVEDVRSLGRTVVDLVELEGVAKLDFKRGPDGRLHLLEINPRFNLWHFPGAIAGVNLPALVYADLTDGHRPAAGRARAGVRWCYHVHDAEAARQEGIPLHRWLPWALRCEAISVFDLRDPMPFLRGVLLRRAVSRLRRA
jgi:predicted ATP-grasp superfamily ATP-dependent carboligase